MPRSLVIVSKSLAPYRVRFYREVARYLSTCGWQTTLIVATAGAKDHPWLNPGEGDSSLRLLEIKGLLQDTPLWQGMRAMAGLPADSALPSPSLLRELGKLDPEIVWTHEYSPFCLAAAAWASLQGRVSLLSTDLGNSPPPYACSKKGLWLHRAVSFLFQAVIAQTKEATRRSHPSSAPMIFAPHAIDTSEYHPRVDRN